MILSYLSPHLPPRRLFANRLDRRGRPIGYADFTYLKDYHKRLVMRLSQDYTRQRKKKNYKLRSFANKYKTRFTPLAHLVAEYDR